MGKILCVEFQRYPLKFHAKYLTHTLKDMYVIDRWKFMSYYRKTFSISRTKSQSLNVTCILAQLSSLNPLKPTVKLRMKM